MKKTDNNNVEKLQNKSIDKLKGIAKLRRIKNRDKLKSESSNDIGILMILMMKLMIVK